MTCTQSPIRPGVLAAAFASPSSACSSVLPARAEPSSQLLAALAEKTWTHPITGARHSVLGRDHRAVVLQSIAP